MGSGMSSTTHEGENRHGARPSRVSVSSASPPPPQQPRVFLFRGQATTYPTAASAAAAAALPRSAAPGEASKQLGLPSAPPYTVTVTKTTTVIEITPTAAAARPAAVVEPNARFAYPMTYGRDQWP